MIISYGQIAGLGRRTINGEPQEDTACFDSTLHLVDPLIVEVHPCWKLSDDFAWLCIFPESLRGEVLVHAKGVKAPFPFRSMTEQADRSRKDRARWR